MLAVMFAVAWPNVRVHADTTSAAPVFTSTDVGFAEGSTLGQDFTRRLDGMATYVPGTSPILRVELDWWYVEGCRGCALRWDRVDAAVNGAADRGMRVLLVLDYAPPWANGGHASDKWFPTADDDWTSIIDRTVRHVGAKVQAYEVWNEPNISAFGNYAGDPKARYWQLVRLASRHVHAGCATCVVVAGASASGSGGAESGAWLDWAYANGYGGDFDAVAHHPYPAWNSGFGPDRSECVNRWWNMFGPPGESPACGELAYVHSVMVNHGDTTKKIWATEWGYPTAGAAGTPLATVRDYMTQGVRMWRALPYTGPLFVYSYRDSCDTLSDPECNFGVVTTAFAAKQPLFRDLSTALRQDSSAALRSGQSLFRWGPMTSLDGRFQLWLQEDGNLVLYRRAALWATGTFDGVRLDNQPDGNLVLSRADGTVAWSSRTAGNGPSTLWLQEDGNLVLYSDSDAKPTWSSGTAGQY